MMLLGVHFSCFLHVSLSSPSCGQIMGTEALRLAVVCSQSWEKNHLGAIVVVILAINEGSVSGKQLNMHSC